MMNIKLTWDEAAAGVKVKTLARERSLEAKREVADNLLINLASIVSFLFLAFDRGI